MEGHEETVAFSWGWGGEGRLGSGSGAQDKLVPTLVNKAPNTTTRFVDAAAGKRHSLAVSEEGVVYAWGDGASGQLGSFRVPKRVVEESESESEEEEEKEETKGSARDRAKAKVCRRETGCVVVRLGVLSGVCTRQGQGQGMLSIDVGS